MADKNSSQKAAEKTQAALMDKIVALCKRRGFIFQSSEIYGGINGFWDYGPLGCELKRNIKDAWWRDVVMMRDDVVGLDASIIMHPKVWEASGHVGGFQDPMQTCRQCRKHFRADQVWDAIVDSDWHASLAELFAGLPETNLLSVDSAALMKWAMGKGKKLAPGLALVRDPQITLSWLAERVQKEPQKPLPKPDMLRYLATAQFAQTGLVTPCPNCGGELTEPRQFNLMFDTYVGAVHDEENKAYLRPETAQGIFANFLNIVNTARQKVPFGIAQIGKAFRNEINPRNFTFRSREFEQMELEFFVKPGTDAQWHEYWVKERMKWYETIGLPASKLKPYIYKKEELAHYASACVDVYFDFPFGSQELEGIAARGDFDLSQHQQHSGKSMEYFDDETKEKYIPHVVEPSAGVDRIALALLCNAYFEEWAPTSEAAGAAPIPVEHGRQPPKGFESRVVMRFAPRIAPTKVAVFPLLKNRPPLVEKAKEVFHLLRGRFSAFYDDGGAIGRRYRRQDEAGTPFGVTIDFETLGEKGPDLKDTVTMRDRDTLKQERVAIKELPARIAEVVR